MVPLSVRYVPGTMMLAHDVDDAVGVDRGPRRDDDRAVAGRAPRAQHPYPPAHRRGRRAHAGAAGRVHRRARSRSRRCASRCSTTDARRRDGRWSATTGCAPTPPTATSASGSARTCGSGIEGNRVRARHTTGRGRAPVLRALLGSAPGRARRCRRCLRADSPRPATSGAAGWPAAGSPTIAGAPTCSARRSPSKASRTPRRAPPWPPPPPRCPRRPAESATGTTGTAGCATRPSPCGGCTRSGSTGRPTTSCSSWPTSTAMATAPCRSCTASVASAT